MYIKVKTALEEISYKLASGTPPREVYAMLISLINELEVMNQNKSEERTNAFPTYYPHQQQGEAMLNDNEEKIIHETRKIDRKLQRWAHEGNQHQQNARTLNAFLTLQWEEKKRITKYDMKIKIGGDDVHQWFEGNFSQMKNYGENNQAKVFCMNGDAIEIWPPAEEYVRKYERTVFGDNKRQEEESNE